MVKPNLSTSKFIKLQPFIYDDVNAIFKRLAECKKGKEKRKKEKKEKRKKKQRKKEKKKQKEKLLKILIFSENLLCYSEKHKDSLLRL